MENVSAVGQFASTGFGTPSTPFNSGSSYGVSSSPPAFYASSMASTALQPGVMAIPQASGANFEANPGAEKRSGPGVGMIVGVVIMLIVLVGGGFLGYAYFSHDIAKPARVAATPLPVPKGSPLFADYFKDNMNGWDLLSQTGAYTVTLSNGVLTLEDDSNKLLPVFVPGGRTFGDFKLMVDAVLSKGDQSNGYGLFIRGASNQHSALATYYRFELYGDGSYAVFKGSVDGSGKSSTTALVDVTQHAAIQMQGSLNHIMVIAKGPSLTFVVNGYTLKVLSDSSYAGGSVALFVSNAPGAHPGAQAKFSNLALYSPDA